MVIKDVRKGTAESSGLGAEPGIKSFWVEGCFKSFISLSIKGKTQDIRAIESAIKDTTKGATEAQSMRKCPWPQT